MLIELYEESEAVHKNREALEEAKKQKNRRKGNVKNTTFDIMKKLIGPLH